MTIILVSLVCLGILGIVFGAGLAIASRRFHVDVDPRVEEILEALPNANCGACGYAGCAAFAVAVANGEAPVDGCVPGGAEYARVVAAIMGVEAAGPEPRRAVVRCQGGRAEARREADYAGVRDCRAAALIQGGPKACKHGCLGFGTCAAVCPFDAITMSPNGLPVISEERCSACGLCVAACPVGIISILPSRYRVYLACSNPAKGKTVKEICSVGCISCRQCVKATESGAIQWGDGLPKIDFEKWTDPDAALTKCPMNCFADARVGLAAAEV